MLSAVLLALSAAAVSADYIMVSQYSAANCAGAAAVRNAQQLGCQPAGSGFWLAVGCINSTWGVINYYTTDSCTGPIATSPAPAIINGFPWGCSSSGSQSSQGTCVTGTWAAPASSVAISNYPNTPACPVAAGVSASSALSYTAGTCIPFGSGTVKATCTSSSYTTTQFSSADCSGTGSTLATGSLGCGPNPVSGQQGVSVAQCTSGASSASIAFASIALMLVAAASASAL
jgi:hypothetical protein